MHIDIDTKITWYITRTGSPLLGKISALATSDKIYPSYLYQLLSMSAHALTRSADAWREANKRRKAKRAIERDR